MAKGFVPLARILPGAKMPMTTFCNDDEQPGHNLVDEARKARAVADFTRVVEQTGILDSDKTRTKSHSG